MRSTNLFRLTLVIIILVLVYLKWDASDEIETYIAPSATPNPVATRIPTPSLDPSPISTDSATPSAILE